MERRLIFAVTTVGKSFYPRPPVPSQRASLDAVAENKVATKQGGLRTLKDSAIFTCPMHPEVRQEGPGACPKCGMALEPLTPSTTATKTEWTCPMHPEIIRNVPGSCPICGMALEPKTITAEEEENPELIDMTRRFKVSVLLTVPLVLIVMGGMVPGLSSLIGLIPPEVRKWLELFLATPVVLWGGWPFFVRGWRSVATWNLNMFTLIAIGTGVSYVYSL
jgi:Cu+-exporting ATPase